MRKRAIQNRSAESAGCIYPAILRKCLLTAWLGFFLLLALCPAFGAAKDAAMIYRVEGRGKVAINGVARKTVVMQQLKSGDKVKIPDNTSVIFILYKDRTKYRVTGSALVKIAPSGITLVKGRKDAVSLLEKSTAFLFPGTQEVADSEIGAMTVRDFGEVPALTLLDEKADKKTDDGKLPSRDAHKIVLNFPDVRDKKPAFTWTDPEREGSYTVTLEEVKTGEIKNRLLFQEKNVEGYKLSYPGFLMPLQYGRDYRVTVDVSGASPSRAAGYTFRLLPNSDLKSLNEKKKVFDEMVKQEPQNPEIYALMAAAYAENGLNVEARPLYEKVAQLLPGNREAKKRLSEVYYRLGWVDEAYKAREESGK